jgi:hypothetical protein
MKVKKILILIFVICLTGFSLQAQTQRLKTIEKGYPFNPDYPDFYYGDEKVFLELIFYQRNADDSKSFDNRYLIQFSGMTRMPNGTKKYLASTWGFDSLDEFKYYKDLIENKKYYRILLKEPKYGMVNCDIHVLMHPRRKIPKL